MTDVPQDYFEQRRQEQQALCQQLEAAPLVEVRGVVHPSAPGLIRSPEDPAWTLVVKVPVWRIASGPTHRTPLYLRCFISSLEARQPDLCPGSVVRVNAKVVVRSVLGRPDALLVDVLQDDGSDVELNEFAQSLRTPAYFDDPHLGRFTLDRRLDVWDGTCEWLGAPLRVSLCASERPDAERCLECVRALCGDQLEWDSRLLKFAVAEFFPIWQQCWKQGGDPNLTELQFCRRFHKDALVARPDGSFEFWFLPDVGLFGGHSIAVYASLAFGPKRANLEG